MQTVAAFWQNLEHLSHTVLVNTFFIFIASNHIKMQAHLAPIDDTPSCYSKYSKVMENPEPFIVVGSSPVRKGKVELKIRISKWFLRNGQFKQNL